VACAPVWAGCAGPQGCTAGIRVVSRSIRVVSSVARMPHLPAGPWHLLERSCMELGYAGQLLLLTQLTWLEV
jgi:hypothetical protein